MGLCPYGSDNASSHTLTRIQQGLKSGAAAVLRRVVLPGRDKAVALLKRTLGGERQKARSFAAAALNGAGVSTRMVRWALNDKAVVFMFHRVLPRAECAQYYDAERVVSAESFDCLLHFLSANFQVVSLSELIGLVRRGRLSSPVCSLTFDDGWEDNYRCAWPILRRHQLSATIFLALDYIGRRRPLWPDELYRLWSASPTEQREEMWQRIRAGFIALRNQTRPLEFGSLRRLVSRLAAEERGELLAYLRQQLPVEAALLPDRTFLSWREIELMLKNSVSYGSHTLSHPALTGVSHAQLIKELYESKRLLEEKLRQPVKWLAYPYGAFDAQVLSETWRAGYDVGLTSVVAPARAHAGPLLLPRVGVSEEILTDRRGRFDASVLLLHLTNVLFWAGLAGFSGTLWPKELGRSGDPAQLTFAKCTEDFRSASAFRCEQRWGAC